MLKFKVVILQICFSLFQAESILDTTYDGMVGHFIKLKPSCYILFILFTFINDGEGGYRISDKINERGRGLKASKKCDVI